MAVTSSRSVIMLHASAVLQTQPPHSAAFVLMIRIQLGTQRVCLCARKERVCLCSSNRISQGNYCLGFCSLGRATRVKGNHTSGNHLNKMVANKVGICMAKKNLNSQLFLCQKVKVMNVYWLQMQCLQRGMALSVKEYIGRFLFRNMSRPQSHLIRSRTDPFVVESI